VCDFPRCEDWTVHDLLGSFRQRGLTGLLKALPCDVWKAIYGRTTWLVGDSQTQYFYRTMRCILKGNFLEEEGLQVSLRTMRAVNSLPGQAKYINGNWEGRPC
jgi:hypothetical protein